MDATDAIMRETPEGLSDVVTLWAHRTPAAEAAVLGELRWTYAELQERISALAAASFNAGVRKGDRVATLQSAHPDFLVALLASTSIGAIWVGLNPKYGLAELLQIAGDSEPKVLLTRTHVMGRRYDAELAELRAKVPSIERVVVFDGDPLIPGAFSLNAFIQERDSSSVGSS